MRNILVLIFLSCLTPVYCQTNDITKCFWLTGGLGSWSSGDYGGFSLSAGLNWSRNKTIETNNGKIYAGSDLQLRYIYNTSMNGENDYENLTEFGLLYGKSFGRVLQLTMAGGLGVVSSYAKVGHIDYS